MRAVLGSLAILLATPSDGAIIVGGGMILGVIGLALLLASYATKGWTVRWKEQAIKAAALPLAASILLPYSTRRQEKELSPKGCDIEVSTVGSPIPEGTRRNCTITGWVNRWGTHICL